jgi:hypothetical protein
MTDEKRNTNVNNHCLEPTNNQQPIIIMERFLGGKRVKGKLGKIAFDASGRLWYSGHVRRAGGPLDLRFSIDDLRFFLPGTQGQIVNGKLKIVNLKGIARWRRIWSSFTRSV